MKERNEEIIRSGLQKLEQMGCEIHYFRDGEYEIPKEHDLSLVPERSRRNLLNTLHALEEYIRMPAIVDNFIDHSKRRDWYSTLGKDVYLASQNNRLRGNKINNVFLAFVLLEDKYFQNIPQVRNALVKIEEDSEKCNPHLKERNTLEYADAVAEASLKVLQMFEKKQGK